MTPQAFIGVSVIMLICGHVVLYCWSDKRHRFSGAMFLTAAWAFAGVANLQHSNQCEHLKNEIGETRAEQRGDNIAFEGHHWEVPLSTGTITFTGAKPKVDERWHVNQNINL